MFVLAEPLLLLEWERRVWLPRENGAGRIVAALQCFSILHGFLATLSIGTMILLSLYLHDRFCIRRCLDMMNAFAFFFAFDPRKFSYLFQLRVKGSSRLRVLGEGFIQPRESRLERANVAKTFPA